ncbi:MAG: cupin-like domain-containing protein [Candidatus Hodarchaeales archaeon]|jgi:hypothetical protein
MNYFIAIFIFCVVLFLYLHIYYHLKTSNDLEVYTIERPSKNKLEEICDLRQPVVFEFSNERLLDSCNLASLDDNYGAFDIKLRDIRNKDEDSELYLPFLLKEALKIFQNDKKSKYITENNREFLEETAAIKNFRYNDSFLRPPMVSKCIYDFWSGSIGAQTPLRYNLEYRTFIYITSGKAKLKLIPPHSGKYLNLEKDYDNFEFRSPVNPWNIQNEYKADFDKVKVLDLDVVPGYMIFIPAYWWYSIEYEELSSICIFKYRTFMSSLSTLPQTLMSYLQKQNIKREIAKKLEIVENVIPLNKAEKTDLKVE